MKPLPKQAEWLHDTANRTRVSQAALMRRALDDLIHRLEAPPADPVDDTSTEPPAT